MLHGSRSFKIHVFYGHLAIYFVRSSYGAPPYVYEEETPCEQICLILDLRPN